MTGVDEDDPLAELQPRTRMAEKKARLIQLARSILNARLRGVFLEDIAKGLANLPKNPVSVSPDYLNDVMTEYHGSEWPKGEPRKRKRAAGRGKGKGTARAKAGAAGDNAAGKVAAMDAAKDEIKATEQATSGEPDQTGASASEKRTAAESRSQSSPDLRHAAYRRAGQKP